MNNDIIRKILMVAGICLSASAIIFLCLSIFGYGNDWTLIAALACSSLSLLFQTVKPKAKQ